MFRNPSHPVFLFNPGIEHDSLSIAASTASA
jgi:hypothetical protein